MDITGNTWRNQLMNVLNSYFDKKSTATNKAVVNNGIAITNNALISPAELDTKYEDEHEYVMNYR